MLNWERLLTEQRLRRSETRSSLTRSPFEQDADLVVFSAAFRRLQDKTQVHPLAEGGRVRSRLTHSIEVASVGRSLGSAAAHALREARGFDAARCHAMADVVHAACLAHDIGNPPFGHGGEDAIQAWFLTHPSARAGLTPEQDADLLAFDGNAQGFRTLTQLENYRFDGGLRLTHATLGALMKYTVGALDRDRSGALAARKKPGFFSAERPYVDELRQSLGLPYGVRHPLVYLTEAADDICYAIVDLEDGFEAGLLDHAEAADVLARLAGRPPDPALGRAEQLQKLRGIAINVLVHAVADVFAAEEPALLLGESVPELCASTRLGPVVAEAKALARARIYEARPVVERLLGGQVVLDALLDVLVPIVEALSAVDFERSRLRGRFATIAHVLGPSYVPRDRYEALLGVTDFLGSLTDHAALSLQRRLANVA